MATSSFDKEFIVKDPKTVSSFKQKLEAPAVSVVTVKRKELSRESAKGIQLLKRSLYA